MKSMAAVALIVAMLALPACAQGSMARGGFAGHGGSVGHGGVSAPTGIRFAAPGRSFALPPPSTFNPSLRVNPAFRPGSFNRYPRRPPFVPLYRRRVVTINPVWPGISPYYSYSGYPGFFDNGDYSQPYPNNQQVPPPDYGSAPYPNYGAAPPSAQSQYGPSYGPSPPFTYYVLPLPAPPREENPVTVIFRDGRAPEQIRNYMLTSTTLTVLDQPYRQIPLDQIDIAATVEVNRQAGVDFHVPGSSP